jgi:hypothetical protein
MKGKSKKVIAVSFMAIMVMMAFLGVVSAVTIEHHTMCKGTEDSIVAVHGSTGHASSPVNETTEFYVTDSRAVCLVHIKQINRSDTFRFEWYDPSDLLYQVDNSSTDPYFRCWFGIYSDRKTSYETQGYKILQLGTVNVSPPQLGWGTCWVSRSLKIDGYPPANKIGNWHVDFYYNDEKQFTETFTISDSIPESGAPTIQTTGDIDINEIMYNPPGADTDHEWLELYNNDTTDIDITGWGFYEAGTDHSLTLIQRSMVIPSGGYAIIADNATMFLDVDEGCNRTVIDSAFSLNNSGEYIALKNATLGIIDEVAYNTSWGADGNGRTLELNATGGWEESRVDGGTPCQPNSVFTTAVIIDTDGNAYKVWDLEAKYTAGGLWIGSRPTRIKKSLFIVLYTTKDRITTTEDLKVPFASMRRLVFEGGSVPEELNEVFEGHKPIRIEMLDGSVILLSDTLLVEMDAEGNQTKAVEMKRFLFEVGEIQGKKITLDGFSSRAKTESGKEGDFWISLSETRSIKFEWP